MKKLAILLVFTALASACGGGGGGDNTAGDVPFFAGVWRGEAGPVVDDCNLSDGEFTFVHTVNQDGARVVLDVLGGATFSGVVNAGNDGFKVSRPANVTGNCVGTTRIDYLTLPDEDRATVGMQLDVTCGNLNCGVMYIGSAVRDH